MSVALKLLGIQPGANETRVQVQLTVTGAYATFLPGPPPSGGDTINFAPLVGVGAGGVGVFAQNNAPLYGVIQGSSGDDYDFIPGSNLTNNIMVINTASNTPLGAGNYPPRITGDLYLYGEFVFQSNL
jgi:hypothetical protein